MSRTPRHGRLAALVVMAGLLLGGCAIPLPEVEADPPVDAPMPALDQTRLDRVLEDVTASLAAGDEESDPALLAPRLSGPALKLRTAEYALAAATAGTENPTTPQPLTLEPEQVVMGTDEEWPTTAIVATSIGEGMNTPLLVGLRQTTPRDPYAMIAWVRLLPGVTTPATAEGGSAPVAPDAEGLVLSPAQALTAYADVLENDDDSESAGAFADDVFRDLVVEDRAAIEESVSEAGTYSETFRLGETPPISLETADGGAIVMGAFRSDQTYTLSEEGGELTISTPDIVALADADGPIDVDESLTATYVLTVALYVPPASEDATITVLGAERVLESVTTG